MKSEIQLKLKNSKGEYYTGYARGSRYDSWSDSKKDARKYDSIEEIQAEIKELGEDTIEPGEYQIETVLIVTE